jgi:hypothetical protein
MLHELAVRYQARLRESKVPGGRTLDENMTIGSMGSAHRGSARGSAHRGSAQRGSTGSRGQGVAGLGLARAAARVDSRPARASTVTVARRGKGAPSRRTLPAPELPSAHGSSSHSKRGSSRSKRGSSRTKSKSESKSEGKGKSKSKSKSNSQSRGLGVGLGLDLAGDEAGPGDADANPWGQTDDEVYTSSLFNGMVEDILKSHGMPSSGGAPRRHQRTRRSTRARR